MVADRIPEVIGSPAPGGIISLQHGELRLSKDSGKPLEIGLVQGDLLAGGLLRYDSNPVVKNDDPIIQPGKTPGTVIVCKNCRR